MKKVLFLTILPFLLLGTVRLNAQVTIGAEREPHPGAVLDLQSTKGLKLPVVDIFDAKVFQLSADGSEAVGMIVYNTWANTVDGQGVGVYVWDGVKWQFVAISGGAGNPVNQIAVTSEAESVTTGGQVQFYAAVYPTSATNPNYSWSVVPNPGTGVVAASGLFTADNPGKVKVRATARDGSGVYGEKEITINPATYLVTSITISAAGNATTLNSGETLQMSASVLPSNATNPAVKWTITSGTAASVNENTGLVEGTGSGAVTVQAAATDGSGVTATYSLTVIAFVGETTHEGYNIYCYPNHLGCWMTDNSKLGTSTATAYSGHSSGERGYYYSRSNSSTACPDGYRLATKAEWLALASYVNSTDDAKLYWTSEAELAGKWDNGYGSWMSWGTHNWVWLSDTDLLGQSTRTSLTLTTNVVYNHYSVRCVQSN
jgi:uncharacterized protein YjdB